MDDPGATGHDAPNLSDRMGMGSIDLRSANLPQSDGAPAPETERFDIIASASAYLSGDQSLNWDQLKLIAAKVGIVKPRDFAIAALGTGLVVLAIAVYLFWPANREKALETMQNFKYEVPPVGMENGYARE